VIFYHWYIQIKDRGQFLGFYPLKTDLNSTSNFTIYVKFETCSMNLILYLVMASMLMFMAGVTRVNKRSVKPFKSYSLNIT